MSDTDTINNLLESYQLSIPQEKERILPFFKELWVLNSKLSYEECELISKALESTFADDQQVEGCTSLLLMNSAYVRNKSEEFNRISEKVLNIFIATNNKEGEGAWYILTGSSYRGLGNNDSALSYIEKGIKLIPEESPYSRFLALGYYQGGEIFFLFNKLDESLSYFYKAINVSEQDIFLKARSLNGIGNVYLKQQQYEEAFDILNQAYNLIKNSGSHILIARILSDIGNYYYETKNYSLALEYENKSYELRKEINLIDPRITNLLHFYQIYQAIGETDKAFQSIQEAYTLAQEKGLKGKLPEIHQKRVEYFENNHRLQEALDELKLYVSTRERELNSSFDLKVNGIKAVHDLEFARKEANATREKNKVLAESNEKINAKNLELKLTLDELTRTKISRKSVVITLIIGISLCLLTEVFVDPLIDNYAYNVYISLAVKALIAISLKPIDSMYENYLIKKAMK